MSEQVVENVKKKPGKLRRVLRIVLLVILAVMIWRLIHDRRATAAYQAAAKRMSELERKSNQSSDTDPLTPAEVREAMGRDSVTGKPRAVEHYYREDYTWQRGLPWMDYSICVIYRDTEVDGPVYFHFVQGDEPTASDLPVKRDIYGDRVEANIEAHQREQEAKSGDDGGS